jgi:hypothetical protein
LLASGISCLVTFDFPAPESVPAFRPLEQVAVVTVPETAVYQDDSIVTAQHDVRLAGQSRIVKAIPKS